MPMTRWAALGPLFLAVPSLPAQAPGAPAPAPPSTTQAPAATGQPAVQPIVATQRANWFSDRRALRVGDLITIVVDETANASEREHYLAGARRSQQMGLNLNVGAVAVGPQKGFESGVNNDTRNTGDAGRGGDLSAVISVRVVSLEPNGIARIKGEKTVGVDGRNQIIQLEGVVRPEDVSAQNVVPSSRVAESVISYKGKKIGPAKGILGSILSIFWP